MAKCDTDIGGFAQNSLFFTYSLPDLSQNIPVIHVETIGNSG
jgi:hypothetical protein